MHFYLKTKKQFELNFYRSGGTILAVWGFANINKCVRFSVHFQLHGPKNHVKFIFQIN